MKVGDIVKGFNTNHNMISVISGTTTRDGMLSHILGLYSQSEDTVELWFPDEIFGLVVKIDAPLGGNGEYIAQVLLEKRLVWFRTNDLIVVKRTHI